MYVCACYMDGGDGTVATVVGVCVCVCEVGMLTLLITHLDGQ